MKDAKHLKCPNCGKNLFEKENLPILFYIKVILLKNN